MNQSRIVSGQFSLFVPDDGQRAAGVEDSSVHLQLEERKGKAFSSLIHTDTESILFIYFFKIFSC